MERPLGVGYTASFPDIFFLNFSVKNAGSYTFLLRKKLYLWPETGTGGLIDPCGLKM